MRKIFLVIIILFLCSLAFAEDKPYRIMHAFSAGELWDGLSAREDLAKFQSGCSLMENMIPIPQGGADKRPGTIYVAEVKNSSLATRIIPFEYSTEQSYIIEVGNQYIRFYTDNAAVLDGVGTETLTTVNDGLVAHWLLNEDIGVTVANANDPGTLDGTSSADASTLHATGKVGTGCFDLDGQYNVYVADDANLSFTDDSNDEAFSLACWAYITQQSGVQNLISKWDETTGAAVMEYRLSLNNERKLQLHLGDTNVDLSADLLAQWYLNDTDADQVVDEVGTTYTGGLTPSNCDGVTATGLAAMTPCFDFGGAEAVEVTDNAVFSFVTANNDDPFSIAAWVNVDSSVYQAIVSKHDGTTGSEAREWMLMSYFGNLSLQLWDEGSDAYVYKTADDALDSGWRFVVATYDGTTGLAAYGGITLYVDGEVEDATGWRSGAYTAMEDTATDVVIGAAYGTAGTLTHFWQDKIDNVIVVDAEISAATVSALYNGGVGREILASTATEISAVADDALDLGWHFLASTYSAPDNTAASSIILYVDGAAVDSTKTNDDDYVAMQDGAGLFRIGAQESIAGAAEKFWGDKIDEVSLFKDVLTPTEVAGLYTTTPYEVNTPYLTADLFELKYEQSADVLFITHPDYETRKLSRYANALWTVTAIDIDDGPFRTQNSDVADFIASSATTGTVTLTATGCNPFVMGTTAGHSPSGSEVTSKSQTGALFKLVHPLTPLEYSETLTDNYTNSQVENTSWMSLGTLYKDAGWTLTTLGTWTGTLEIQRNYTIGAAHGADGWESIFDFASTDDRNVSTAGSAGADAGTSTTEGTEADGAADYRAILTASGDASEVCKVYWTTDQTEVVGIVEITSVASTTSAIGTVVQTIASTDATYKWSEGAWSNYRGWPGTVTFFEDRLIFGGNSSQPDTIWGSVTADYENMEAGVNDDEAVIFTLSSRQVNVIRWLVGKNKILIGTSGAEWSLAGSADEPLTPSNVKAEQQSTYGSANLQANLANESVLFFQRGAEKMRELAYNWELDSYVAPDMTILAKEVTGGGITDTAFQQIPDSILWCVREDGEIAVFSYERKENITSWSRLITDGDFESVASIHGTVEDVVYVSVERTIDSDTVRYIEYFSARDFGDDPCDAFYVDCGITQDSTATATVTGLTHLEGETVSVLGDGAVLGNEVVSGNQITIDSACSQVRVGLPYTVKLRTMPLSWVGEGTTIHGRIKRINEVIPEWYESGDFYVGKDSTNKGLISITGQTTDLDRITFPPGYGRTGYVYIYQLSPEPLTLIALMVEFMIF